MNKSYLEVSIRYKSYNVKYITGMNLSGYLMAQSYSTDIAY